MTREDANDIHLGGALSGIRSTNLSMSTVAAKCLTLCQHHSPDDVLSWPSTSHVARPTTQGG
jgi:hypothetical protein